MMKHLVLALMFVAGSLGSDFAYADAKKKRDPSWAITYTGDLSGKISGSITAVAGASSSTAIRGATPVLGGPTFNGSVFLAPGKTGPATIAPFSMTLADGTKCSQGAETRVRANVRNGERKTYHI
ncbi:MAG: hypothetical protein KJN97_04510, partial [Deltaproteobacteria bacterium]|nr:hypothetical protein [Deltaproteobacteria bacterium]